MWHVRSRPCHVVLSEMALASQAALLLYQGLDGHYCTILYCICVRCLTFPIARFGWPFTLRLCPCVLTISPVTSIDTY